MDDVDSELSDAEVIRRSLRVPELFAVVFDRHHAAIHAYAARRAGRDVADEILSDVFLAAFQSRRRYNHSTVDARAWLYGIAGNVLRRSWRTAASQERLTLTAFDLATREAASWATEQARHEAASDQWDVVRRLLDGLTDGDREALLLYVWEELTYPEIAEAMNIPVGTVRSRIHRARVYLRGALELSSAKEDL